MATKDPALNSRQPPVCSVCVANYNGIGVIGPCLDSVRAQDCEFPIEILVHDDASTDGSTAYIAENYPEVMLITSDTNVGFCTSNNRMVDRARGRYILLLNNDATLHPDALRTLHRRSAQSARPEILGLPQYDIQSGELIDRGCRLDPFLNPTPNLDPTRSHVAMQIGACLWLSRALWHELGGFPDWFGSLAEDMYLCLAAWTLGYSVHIENSSGYDHWVGRSLGGGKLLERRLSTSYRRRALSERNKSYVMIIFFPAPFLMTVLPFHLMLLVLEGLLLTLVKRSWRPWREIYASTFLALWHNRRRLLRVRARLQRRRKLTAIGFASLFTVVPYKLKMLCRHGIPRLS